MPTLEELAAQTGTPLIHGKPETPPEAPAETPAPEEAPAGPSPLIRSFWDLLTCPTGEGELDDYRAHVLNWDGEPSTSRIVRGITGIFGSLNYALIDLGLGIIQKVGKKSAKP